MDWVELIIFLLLIAAALLFGGKKKQPQQQVRQRPSAPGAQELDVEPPPRLAPRTPEQAPGEDVLTTAEAVFEQIRRRMEIEAERIRRPEPTAPSAPPAPPAASSIETLTPAGRASHERFHERYIEPLESVEEWGKRRARSGRVGPRSAREAMIWGAIFGKPKAMGG